MYTFSRGLFGVLRFEGRKCMEEKLIELHVVLCSVCLEFTAKLFWHLEIEGARVESLFLGEYLFGLGGFLK